jgi:hypothetical protein
MWALGGRGGIYSYSFLTSALDGVSGRRHASAALYHRGKDSRYPMHRRLGRPQSRSGHRGWRTNPLPLPRIEPRAPSRPIRIQTLYWLSYPSFHWFSVRTDWSWRGRCFIINRLDRLGKTLSRTADSCDMTQIQYFSFNAKVTCWL